jgi:hypothetical protein
MRLRISRGLLGEGDRHDLAFGQALRQQARSGRPACVLPVPAPAPSNTSRSASGGGAVLVGGEIEMRKRIHRFHPAEG